MDSELLQSFVRVGISGDGRDDGVPEPSRLYPALKKSSLKKPSSDDGTSTIPSWSRRKNVVVIEQRKMTKKVVGFAIDECYCDKDRAAAVSLGQLDIKLDLKAKHNAERLNLKTRIGPDDSEPMAFLMLGMREIKTRNIENGVLFLSKVFFLFLDSFNF